MSEIKDKIKILYPQMADETYKELLKILDSFKFRKNKISPIFTEKDIVLICYADHIKEEKTKTLKTMHKFLNKYAKNYINKIHFLPFYPYSSDDGFSIINYYKINKSYGDWKDIKKISKKFSLIFDFVLNHASVKGNYFKKFIAGDKDYKDFFIVFDKKIDTSKVFRPRTSSLLTSFKTKSNKTKYIWTTFSSDQADFNYKNPKVFLNAVKILLFYLKNNASAIRFDAVAYIWKELGTNCFNRPQAHIFMQLINCILKKIAPNVWILSETVLPHKDNITYWGNGKNEANLVYNFTLETALLAMLFKQDASVLINWINTWKFIGKKSTLLNLSVSHDGIHTVPVKKITSKKDIALVAKICKKRGGKVLYRTISGKKPEPYEFNITYPSATGSPKAFLATQAIQLALRGVPFIYLNNFIGAENWIEGVKKTGQSRAINREKFNYNKLVRELENPHSIKHKIYTGYIELIKARISEPLFSPLTNQKAIKINSHIMAILRFKNKKKLLALTNVSDKKIEIKANLIKKYLPKKIMKDIISEDEIVLKNNLSLMPYQSLWLK